MIYLDVCSMLSEAWAHVHVCVRVLACGSRQCGLMLTYLWLQTDGQVEKIEARWKEEGKKNKNVQRRIHKCFTLEFCITALVHSGTDNDGQTDENITLIIIKYWRQGGLSRTGRNLALKIDIISSKMNTFFMTPPGGVLWVSDVKIQHYASFGVFMNDLI